MPIRDFDKSLHLHSLRECVVELQDFEHRIDPRIPPGIDIVDDFIPRMLHRCGQCDGKVLIAEVDGEVAGFATILSKVRNEDPEEGDYEYGLLSDLMVAERFRKQGIGRQLLDAAEVFATARGVRWLKIGVLAANQAANQLYSSMGYSSIYVEREKDLTSHKVVSEPVK
jgi:GNAT superfamily N-acetyltransferase